MLLYDERIFTTKLYFWWSFFITRNDYDIFLEIKDPENININIPKFFKDLDYSISKLSNFNEEELNEFLSDITKEEEYIFKIRST